MSDVPLIKQFLQHQSDFMAYLMAITRDFDAAEEVFQNAAVVVIEKAESDEKIRDFRAWAKEVVRRQALYYLRKRGDAAKRVRSIDPLLLEQINCAFIEDNSDESVMHDEMTALRQCISQVAEPQRTMLTMRYEGRASFDDIGLVVGKSSGAVQRALSRVRKALHDCVRSKLIMSEGT
jgi:RNA polymerase sigma-70 factor (ECF subfamily)